MRTENATRRQTHDDAFESNNSPTIGSEGCTSELILIVDLENVRRYHLYLRPHSQSFFLAHTPSTSKPRARDPQRQHHPATDSTNMDNAAVKNPYLALRAAKIARNEERCVLCSPLALQSFAYHPHLLHFDTFIYSLRELGLLKPPQTATTNTQNRSKPPPRPPQEPTRRSTRLSQRTDQPNYKDVSLPNETSTRKRAWNASIEDDTTDTQQSTQQSKPAVRSTSTATLPTPPPANSVRSISLNVNSLLLGKHGLLGTILEHTGKEAVINKSFELAASTEDQQRFSGVGLSFNKYCGVQEWNNTIFFWVNLGSKDNPVVNDFLDDATRITWYGGSRMHDESPVIQKLLHYGRDAAATDNNSDTNIILWCRKYEVDQKQFTPYMCLGRLSYHSHVPGSQPLSFVWNLLDRDVLKSHADRSVRERFATFTE